MPEEKLFEVLGAPKSEEIVRLDGEPLAPGIPNHLVKSTEWIGWPDLNLEDKVDIRVIDLGETFWYNAPIRIARGGLQAPETIFASEYDHRVDLWRVGLIVRYWPPTLFESLAEIYRRSTSSRSENYHSDGLSELTLLPHR